MQGSGGALLAAGLDGGNTILTIESLILCGSEAAEKRWFPRCGFSLLAEDDSDSKGWHQCAHWYKN